MRHPLTIVHVALLRLEMAAALVAGTVILLIMTMGLIEIAGRGLFNKPIHGYLDIVEQLMVAVAVFGVSYCQATWGNVRMTLVVGALNGRARWIAETIAERPAKSIQGTVYAAWSTTEYPRSRALEQGKLFLAQAHDPANMLEGQRFFASGKRVEWKKH